MGLTGSLSVSEKNSGLFRAPGFIVSPVGKGQRRRRKKGEGKEGKRNRIGKVGGKEEGIKKERTERKKEFSGGESSASFKLVRSVLLVFLSVKWKGVGGGIGFTFLPS